MTKFNCRQTHDDALTLFESLTLALRLDDVVAQQLAESISEFASRNQFMIIDENIDAQDRRRPVGDLGVDLANGSLFGRPIAIEEVTPN